MIRPNQKNNSKALSVIFFTLISLAFIAVLARAFYLQIIQHDTLVKLADNRNKQIKTLPVQKGTILAKDGSLLAASVPVFLVYADPSMIKDTQYYTDRLADILEIDKANLKNLLSKQGRFVILKENLKAYKKKELEALNLIGIGYQQNFQRIYPAQSYLSSILGFSGREDIGLEGLEYSFNQHLIDNSTQTDLLDELYGNTLPGTRGGNVRLTIDDRFQHIAEKELETAIKKSRSKSGTVLILESKTGAILAAAHQPSLNPNIQQLYTDKTTLSPFVGAVYEPGSTFKIITISVALEGGFIKPEESFDCHQGKYKIARHTINDISPIGRASLAQIIQKSSNICAAKIGLKIDKNYFYESILKFGFLDKINIAIKGESAGLLQDSNKWKKVDQAILAYGHGIAVTPLQMIAAINVIANDGIYIKPYLVAELIDSYGKTIEAVTPKTRKVLSYEVASLIKSYMQGVVSPQGTGRLAAIDGIKIAGKTGTTLKFDYALKQYSQSNYILSFIGFFPADDPKITIFTMLDNPKPRKNSDDQRSVTPLFRSIAQHIINLEYPIASQTVLADNNHQTIFVKNKKIPNE